MPSNGGDPGDVENLPLSCQYVLDELDTADDPLTLADLNKRLNHSRESIAWAVRRLNDYGYVRVDRNPGDLREVAVSLRDERTLNPQQSDR